MLVQAPPVAAVPSLAASSSGVDLFSTAPQTATPQPQASPPSGYECYNKNGVSVAIQLQRNAEGIIQAVARFRNASPVALSGVGLQAAVPKSQKLQLLAISNSDLGVGAEATQMMRVSGCKGPLKLRLKISYTGPGGQQVMDQAAFTEPS